MVPEQIDCADAIPVNPTVKISRRQLAGCCAAAAQLSPVTDGRAPRNPASHTESVLAELFRDLSDLHRRRFGAAREAVPLPGLAVLADALRRAGRDVAARTAARLLPGGPETAALLARFATDGTAPAAADRDARRG